MNQSLYITTETNPQDSGGDYSIFNETRVRPKYWQDKFTRVIFSRGGLALSNISILICMLYFSYTAHPASEDVIHACDFTNSSGLFDMPKSMTWTIKYTEKCYKSKNSYYLSCGDIFMGNFILHKISFYCSQSPWNKHKYGYFLYTFWFMCVYGLYYEGLILFPRSKLSISFLCPF